MGRKSKNILEGIDLSDEKQVNDKVNKYINSKIAQEKKKLDKEKEEKVLEIEELNKKISDLVLKFDSLRDEMNEKNSENELLKTELEEVASKKEDKIRTKPTVKRKNFGKNIIVVLKSNKPWEVRLSINEGSINEVISFNNVDSTYEIDFPTLKKIISIKTAVFQRGSIAIVDAYNENEEGEEPELEQIITKLGLKDVYFGEGIAPNEIRKYLSGEIKTNDFAKGVYSSHYTIYALKEMAIYLYSQGKFSDISKMGILKAEFRNKELFR